MTIGIQAANDTTSSKNVLCGASLALAISSLAHGGIVNLVRDGDFEAAPVQTGGFAVYPSASTGIPSWTVLGTEVAIISTTYSEGGFIHSAQSGTRWLDLSGASTPNPGNAVSQVITTNVGQAYDLSFYVGSAWTGSAGGPYRAPTVNVTIGGVTTTYTNSNVAVGAMNWQYFSTVFIATSTSTLLEFAYGNSAGTPNFGVGIDTISVTASVVPAPGVLAGLAAGPIFASRRRARR